MSWLHDLLFAPSVANAILILALVATLGLALGKIKIFGISLGIAGVLFAGLVFGHFHLTANQEMLEFVREFGLILFVYSIGMQVGPGFVDSLRRQGLSLNLMAAAIVLGGLLITTVIHFWGGVPVPVSVGLFSGATTNTPSLAAAQQALKDIPDLAPEIIKLPSLAYAVSYPFGILGIILTMLITKALFRVSLKQEEESLTRQAGGKYERCELARVNIRVKNTNLDGVALKDIPLWASGGIAVSRILHGGETQVATRDTVLHLEDVILVVGAPSKLDEFRMLVGCVSSVNLLEQSGKITSQRMVVTKKSPLGKTMDDLDFMGRYRVAVTRISRSGIEFTPSPVVKLQYGDTLIAVGEPEDLDKVANELGNSSKQLNIPEIVPVFVGLGLGTLLGNVPFHIPGIPAPVKLGLAGGPLLVSILLSRIRRVGPLIWHLPLSANLILRELGIVLFLAAVGLRGGDQFVQTVLSGDGLRWMLMATMITFLPLMIVALVARVFFKWNYLSLCGLLAGSMTDPPALSFAGAITGSEAPAVSYATVYPLTMILRILCAQLMIIALMH